MLERSRADTKAGAGAIPAKNGRKSRTAPAYVAQEQVGFLLRTAFQRHIAIFTARMVASLTSTQFAALVVLYSEKPLTHNELGDLICLDASTIKGVLDRLRHRGLIEAWTTPGDRRSRTVAITSKGRQLVEKAIPQAREITRETLKPLSQKEQALLISLLKRLR